LAAATSQQSNASCDHRQRNDEAEEKSGNSNISSSAKGMLKEDLFSGTRVDRRSATRSRLLNLCCGFHLG